MTRISMLTLCVALIFAGSGTGVTGQSQGPNPCTILSAAELNGILGTAVVKSNGFVTGGDPACMWYDAENLDTVQIILYRTGDLYEMSKGMPGSKPLSGVGAEAHIGKFSTVEVKTPKRAFFVQSMAPVKDGQVSAEVRAAAAGANAEDLAKYEASFRLAKLIAGKL